MNDLQTTELKALIKNFLSDAKKISKDVELKERISKLDSDYVKITKEKDHVPGETVARFRENRKLQNKLKSGRIITAYKK